MVTTTRKTIFKNDPALADPELEFAWRVMTKSQRPPWEVTFLTHLTTILMSLFYHELSVAGTVMVVVVSVSIIVICGQLYWVQF